MFNLNRNGPYIIYSMYMYTNANLARIQMTAHYPTRSVSCPSQSRPDVHPLSVTFKVHRIEINCVCVPGLNAHRVCRVSQTPPGTPEMNGCLHLCQAEGSKHHHPVGSQSRGTDEQTWIKHLWGGLTMG